MERIQKYDFSGDAYRIAQEEFNSAINKYGEPSRNMTEEAMNELYSNLQYVNSLRTSTVRGAHNASKFYQEVSNMLESLSEDKQKEFWGIYGRVYERRKNIAEFFKYQALVESKDEFMSGVSVDEAVENIIRMFGDKADKAYRKKKEREAAKRAKLGIKDDGITLPYS